MRDEATLIIARPLGCPLSPKNTARPSKRKKEVIIARPLSCRPFSQTVARHSKRKKRGYYRPSSRLSPVFSNRRPSF
jgi:hypothetical protein